jgi:hypothetical protein
MGYYDEPENETEPSVFHVTIPIVQQVTIRVEAPFDTDVDDLGVLAYTAYKHGADTICHGPVDVDWDDVSVECAEDNSPSEREWEPDDGDYEFEMKRDREIEDSGPEAA